jgi:hypothetical protein
LTEGDVDDPVFTDLSADLGIGDDLIPRITGAQLRAARAMLNVSQAQVARRLAVHRDTIWRCECDRPGTERTRRQLVGTLKRNRIVFGPDGSVRLRKPLEDYR